MAQTIPKIIVACKDDAYALAIAGIFKPRGFEVKVFVSGEEILPWSRKNLPILAIAQTELPKLSGFSVCNQLKQDLATKDCSIALLFTEDHGEAAKQHRNQPFAGDVYLSFGIAPADLLIQVEPLIQKLIPNYRSSISTQEYQLPQMPEIEDITDTKEILISAPPPLPPAMPEQPYQDFDESFGNDLKEAPIAIEGNIDPEDRIQFLRETLKRKEAGINKIRDQWNEREKLIQKMEAHRSEIRSHSRQVLGRNNQLEHQLAVLNAHYKKQTETIDTLHQNERSLQDRITAYQDHIKKYKEKLHEIHENRLEIAKERDGYYQKLQEQLLILKNNEKEIQYFNDTVGKHDEIIQQKNKEIDAKENDIVKLSHEKDSLKERYDVLQSAYEEERRDTLHYKEKKEQELQRALSKIENLQKSEKELNEIIDNRSRQIESLQNIISDKEKTIQQKENDKDLLAEEIAKLKEANESNEATMARQRNHIADLNTEKQTLSETITRIKEQQQNLQMKYDTEVYEKDRFKKDLENLQTSYERVNGALATNKKDKNQLEQRLSALTAEYDALQRRMVTSENELTEQIKLYEQFKKKSEEIILSMKEKIEILLNEIEDYKEEIFRLREVFEVHKRLSTALQMAYDVLNQPSFESSKIPNNQNNNELQ